MPKKMIAKAQGQKHDGHLPRLMAYLPSGNVAPQIEERFTGKPWVYFGRRNLYPQEMRVLVDNCAPLERCITTAALLIAGKGITFHDRDGGDVPRAVAAFDALMVDATQEEFLFSTAYDIAFMNALSWVVRRAPGDGIVRLDHLDCSRVRADKVMEDGKPTAWYWSQNWARYGQRGMYEPQRMGAYGVTRDEKEVVYSKTYKPGRDVYGEQWWLGAVKAAEVWAKVDKYNESQIDTGFTPSVHLHTYTNRPDEELAEYDKKIMEAYSGAMGRGIFHTYGTPEEGAPAITKLERGDHAGELDGIADRCERVIYNAYGMPPAIMGMDVKTGMDGAGAAIEQAHRQVMNTLVLPKQQMITRTLVKLLNDMGMTEVWEARIEQVEMTGDTLGVVAQGQAYMASVTKNEHRERLGMEPLEDAKGEQFLNAKDVREDIDINDDGAARREQTQDSE